MARETQALGHETRAVIAELIGRYAHLADYGEDARSLGSGTWQPRDTDA